MPLKSQAEHMNQWSQCDVMTVIESYVELARSHAPVLPIGVKYSLTLKRKFIVALANISKYY